MEEEEEELAAEAEEKEERSRRGRNNIDFNRDVLKFVEKIVILVRKY